MLNLVEFLFLSMGATTVLLGSLVNFLEPYLPKFVSRTFRYGKFGGGGSYKDRSWMASLEIPKSKFKHFYAFALLWGAGGLYLGICAYLSGRPIPPFVNSLLDLLISPHRTVETDEVSTFVALFLIFLQIFRRFYETHFIQIFSKTAKINLSHYVVGYLHYYGTILAILAHAPGFVTGTHLSLVYLRQLIDFRIILFSTLFIYAWSYQFISNLILINLRKNKSGAVITEKHLMPTGSYFEFVSSPHMFFELVMYVALWGLMYRNRTFFCVLLFVFCNQIEVAHFNHKWYQSTFPQYPKRRRAFIPFLF